MPNIAFYAGSFDPPDGWASRCHPPRSRHCDELVIAIGTHPGKAPLFTAEERAAMLETVVAELAGGKPTRVTTFNDLTVHAARREGPRSSFVACALARISITRCSLRA